MESWAAACAAAGRPAAGQPLSVPSLSWPPTQRGSALLPAAQPAPGGRCPAGACCMPGQGSAGQARCIREMHSWEEGWQGRAAIISIWGMALIHLKHPCLLFRCPPVCSFTPLEESFRAVARAGHCQLAHEAGRWPAGEQAGRGQHAGFPLPSQPLPHALTHQRRKYSSCPRWQLLE